MTELFSLAALLIVLALCLSLLVFQAITGVPPLSANAAEAAGIVALLQQADIADQAIIYELGSGWGSLAIALAKAFPHAQIRGIELSPLPYWVARLRTRRIANVHLQRANFYACDISDAQAVTCYLMIRPMPKLAAFLDRMLKPATPVAALAFWFRDRKPSMQRQARGQVGGAALYNWPARMLTQPEAHPQSG